MATISTLTLAEKIVLPFSVLVPIIVGAVGYVIWKRDKHRADVTMTQRMAMWFVASSSTMIGLGIYHVIRNLMFAADYRIGMGAFGIVFVIFMCLSMHCDIMQITDDEDILLNERNEMGDYALMDTATIRAVAADINEAQKTIPRRRVIAALTYATIVFQCSFDGLVLKYNPNAQENAVQVAMFFVSKFLESMVVSSALIHGRASTRWYLLYMFNFTVAVGLSMLAAYEVVSPLLIAQVFEHWAFQTVLGASGGLLMMLSYYFIRIESKRSRIVQGSPWIMSLVFSVAFVASALTGMFG